MAYAATATGASPQGTVSQGTVSPRPKPRFRKYVWASVVVVLLALVYVVILALNWPFTEQALIDALQERSLRTVTIGRFYRTYFPPGCTAEDIRFLHRLHKEKQPLITIRKLVLVTNYGRLLTMQERLSLVRVTDMHVTVPPGEPGKPNAVMPLTTSKSGAAIVIDRLIADGAVLDFLPKNGGKPYRLSVDKLRLDGVGNNLPMAYRTIITNPMPPGKIHSSGVFGTWNSKDPGSTPLHGVYRFEHANLSAFGGVSGTLSASGSFKGTLSRVGVQGTAEVPDFTVHDTSHKRALETAYRVTVDCTKGDMVLDEVTARFGGTTANFKGTIAKTNNQEGKTASVEVWTESGRVEDILDLFISDRESPMTGAFTFAGRLNLPSGPEPLVRRMKLEGDFGVTSGRFSNKETEGDLIRLSDSSPHNGSGNSLKKHDKDEPERQTDVLSDLKGHGATANGVATLSDLSFAIPGAKAWMHGTYNLEKYEVDLHGKLLTTGDPSKATSGFKSLMVKVVTPFFKRRHETKVVPFKVTGSYSNVNLGLDF